MRRPLALLALTLLAAMLAVAPAFGARAMQREPQVQATAQIEANGTGAVTLRGRLVTFGLIPGRGSIVVRDFDGDAVVRIDGVLRRIPARTGTLRLARVTGRFYVEGTRVRVRIVGTGMNVSAAGRGRATLAGVGSYRLNDGEQRDWPGATEPVTLQPPRALSRKARAASATL